MYLHHRLVSFAHGATYHTSALGNIHTEVVVQEVELIGCGLVGRAEHAIVCDQGLELAAQVVTLDPIHLRATRQHGTAGRLANARL